MKSPRFQDESARVEEDDLSGLFRLLGGPNEPDPDLRPDDDIQRAEDDSVYPH